jgi:Tol biopolymer transport system component
VAFSWNGESQDNWDIYVKLIGPGPPLRLTSSPHPDMAPAWSPDGRGIAFRRSLGGGRAVLLLVPSLGGPEQTLTELLYIEDGAWARPAWSPDGKWIAFSDREPGDRAAAIFVLSLVSGRRRRITNPPVESNWDRYPAFSPDGRTLAFSRAASVNDGDLFTIPFSDAGDSQSPARLTSQRGVKLSPVWTGDGKEILYSNVVGGQTYSLWRVPVHGGAQAGPRRLAALPDATLPAIAPAARRLAYTRRWRDLEIYRVRLPGGAPARFISSTRSEENPRYSPDGRKIAFRSDRSGDLELWVSDSDGSNASQLTSFGGVGATGVNWSPDGRRIAFRSTVHGHGDIFVIGADGGVPQRITTEPTEEAMPAWSRDGKWLYFASNRGGADQVWKAPSDGGPARQVTIAGGMYSVESPDGRFLYYTKVHGQRSGVWRMPVVGGEETRVLESVRWSGFDVSEEGIYFTPGDGPPAVQFLRFTTGRIEPVARVDKPTAVGLTLSPDRRSILFAVMEHEGSDLMLVESFR